MREEDMDGIKVLKPADLTPEVRDQIIGLGMRSGTWKDPDQYYYRDQFNDPDNIHVAYFIEGRVKGYILARPHNEVVLDYLELDPLIRESDIKMSYVDHVNVDKDISGRSIGMKLICEAVKEANRQGIFRFSLHCRVINGLSRIIQARFHPEIVRRIDRYKDCNNEPFDYIEGDAYLLN